MTARARMTVFLSGLLSGCGLVDDPFARTLDDEACLTLELAATCPSPEQASEELVGDQTCESPVREVVATGDLVSEELIAYINYGYGTTAWDSGDSGAGLLRCCYEAAYKVHEQTSCVLGRPLLHEGLPLTAPLVARADWQAPTPPLRLDPRAAARWAEAARLEHASVPAFARLALDLVALGAPAELLRRTTEAMADEIRHAEACFALAAAYGGAPVGPGPLPLPSAPAATLARVAVDAFREGCVGESLAVALAAAQLRQEADAPAREVLAQIVDDESRHAELAWDVVAWALRVGGADVRAALQAEVGGITLPSAPGADEALAGVLRQVILPTAAELLAA